MTPVDELRSAAVLLRQRAECAQQLMPAPWRVVGTDSESLDGVASCPLHEGGPGDVCDACSVIETHSEWVASYVALLSPAAGLVLADLLDEVAIGLTNMAGIFHADMLTAAGSTGVRLARLLLGGGS